MKKREFPLKVTFSLPSPSSMLKFPFYFPASRGLSASSWETSASREPFYYILSTFNSKMDAEWILCLSLKLLKSLLSIKPQAGNENKIFQRKKLQKYIAQRFEENQAVLKSTFIPNTTTNKMKRTSFQPILNKLTLLARYVKFNAYMVRRNLTQG